MKACNQLLRSWEHFKKMKHKFGFMRRIGRGFLEREITPQRPKLSGSRNNRHSR